MIGTQTLISIIGSVALLLWGVRMVRTGMIRAFGSTIRRILSAYADRRSNAFLLGIAITAILQSSTATALLLTSFASRGMMAGSSALATMLGADIGTAVAAQLLSLEIKWIWTILVGVGVAIFLAFDKDRTRAIGRIAIGLGVMLLALTQITASAEPLRNSEALRSVFSGLSGEPVLGFLVAAILTWIAHSSLSIILLVMLLASVGALPLPLALALVLGANVGGTIAPLVATAGSPSEARRITLGNFLMKLLVAVPALAILSPAIEYLHWISEDPARSVVNFHFIINLVVAALFLPLIGYVHSFTTRLLPDENKALDISKPRNLDPTVIDSPSEALTCAMRETLSLGNRVADMLRQSLIVFEKSDAKLAKEIEKADDTVDALYEAIKLYLVKVSKGEMTEEESRRYVEIITFTTNLEHIGDIIDKNLMELADKKIKNQYTFSREGSEEIGKLYARVLDNMRLSFNVFASRDVTLARRLLEEKTAMRNAELAATDSHYARLREARPESIESSAIHLDVIRDLKRINAHFTSVAYPILENLGELSDTRLRRPDFAGAPKPISNQTVR